MVDGVSSLTQTPVIPIPIISMHYPKHLLLFLSLCPLLAHSFDLNNVLNNAGGDLVKAVTTSEADVIAESKQAVGFMDSQQASEPAPKEYDERLNKLVARVNLPTIEEVNFNFKVYKSEPDDLNAFATPDGSIRFHTALMDAMTDDQVLAVLGHEIGHVAEKHSYRQMKKSLLASAALRGAAGATEIGTSAYNAGMGDLANRFVTASFSRNDEISADAYSIKVLKDAGAPADSMLGALQVLKEKYGDGGGMLSSHPSNDKRMSELKKAIASS